ncbi:hypothetical protein F5B20DRAFT_584675 [Whalleya microplaca]|nr:hypothetical protein F5B20DRAFT_584675 [Whalleya microplaca]
MSSVYMPFAEDFDGRRDDSTYLDLHNVLDTGSRASTKKERRKWCLYITLCLSLAFNLFFFIALFWKFGPETLQMALLAENTTIDGDFNPVDPIVPQKVEEEQMVLIRWAFAYSSGTTAGMDEVDHNWDSIDASLGMVSLGREFAAKHGLPPTMDDPRDPNKVVYTLEGYHSLHCLVVMRHTMFQLAKGEKLDVPFGHSTHCAGALLQTILCNAGATLMYQKPGSGPGDGQMRKCRNWPALRDWAKEHSACMGTNSSGIAFQDLDNCDKIRAGDGVLLDDWPGQ